MTDSPRGTHNGSHPGQQKGPLLLRWLLPSLALVLFGPLVAIPVAALRDPTGGVDATLVLSDAPLLGVIALVIMGVGAAAGGSVTARLTAPGTGRTFAGLCVAWAALRTGDSWRLFEIHGAGAAIPLAIEGALAAIAGIAIASTLAVAGGTHSLEEFKTDARAAVGTGNAAIGIAVGVAAGIAGTVLVALDGQRGQCLAGGFFGALLVAVAVHLATPTLSVEQARLRSIAAVCVLMIVAPLTVFAMPGGGAASDAARAGTLVGPSLVQPVDWLVGIFLGIPTGLGWVGSVSENAQQQTASPRAAR